MINNSKASSLHTALINSQLEIAQVLILQGDLINSQDENGETPLFVAVEFEDAFEMLLNAGADVNVANHVGETPLHEVASNGTIAECKLLLKHGANVNAFDQKGQSPLHAAAAYGNHEIVRLLVEQGASVNDADKKGKTPLHYAVFGNIMSHELNNYLLTAEILIHAGSELQAKTNEGETPLELAKRLLGYPELAALLIQYGAR